MMKSMSRVQLMGRLLSLMISIYGSKYRIVCVNTILCMYYYYGMHNNLQYSLSVCRLGYGSLVGGHPPIIVDDSLN